MTTNKLITMHDETESNVRPAYNALIWSACNAAINIFIPLLIDSLSSVFVILVLSSFLQFYMRRRLLTSEPIARKDIQYFVSQDLLWLGISNGIMFAVIFPIAFLIPFPISLLIILIALIPLGLLLRKITLNKIKPISANDDKLLLSKQLLWNIYLPVLQNFILSALVVVATSLSIYSSLIFLFIVYFLIQWVSIVGLPELKKLSEEPE